MNKKFLLLNVFLLSISIAYSAATYGYNDANGYVSLSEGGMANLMNITLNCSSSIDTFIHYTLTNSLGYYSFAGIFDAYNSSSAQASCLINSSRKGMANITNNAFNFLITAGETFYGQGISANFTFNNTGYADFDFSGLNGTLLSEDGEGIKNKIITLQCPNQINTTLTNESGFYNFSGVNFMHTCTAQGCELSCNVSHGIEYNPFIIDPQGYFGEAVTVNRAENIDYPYNVRANGEFNPSNGSYGNMNNFTFNASNYSGNISSCKYSYNESKAFSNMNEFNISANKAFTAYISAPVSGQYNYYVLCDTANSTESTPRIASYNIFLDGANITINFPINGTVFSKNSAFNISLNAPAKSCSFGIIKNDTIVFISGMANATIQNYIYYAKNDSALLSKITEGENNTAFFSCEDYYGITANKSVNFTADVTAPPAIESFSAKLTNLGNIILTWNPVIDAKYYYIRKSQLTQIGRAFTFYANVSAPISNYEDLNVENYQTYYYEISPVDLYGNEGPVSHSLGIYAVSEQDYKKEIHDLISELGALQNQSLKEENELKEESELLIKALIIKNDLNYFQEFLGLLPINDIETINNIKYLMNNYESKSLDELKSMDYQISYNLNTYLNDYKKSNSIKTLNTTIKSLNITSIVNESVLELNGKKYYKYVITNIISNPSPNLMKSVNLTFKVPSAAIIEGFENINSSINYSIKSLDSMDSQTISYSFISLSDYDNSIAGQMIETAMPKSITAYQVLIESKNSTIIGLIIWGLTLILSISLLFKYKNYRINFKNRQNSN